MLTEFITVGEGGRDGSIWMSPAKSRPPLSYPRLRDVRNRTVALAPWIVRFAKSGSRDSGNQGCAVFEIARIRKPALLETENPRCCTWEMMLDLLDFRNRASPQN